MTLATDSVLHRAAAASAEAAEAEGRLRHREDAEAAAHELDAAAVGATAAAFRPGPREGPPAGERVAVMDVGRRGGLDGSVSCVSEQLSDG